MKRCVYALFVVGWPLNGFIPNAETAVARAVIPIYGADTIRREEPLIAEQKADRWIVRGTLNCGRGRNECIGGTAEIEIAKNDGHIFRVSHYQ
jgi:NTF2 fold immunity protein